MVPFTHRMYRRLGWAAQRRLWPAPSLQPHFLCTSFSKTTPPRSLFWHKNIFSRNKSKHSPKTILSAPQHSTKTTNRGGVVFTYSLLNNAVELFAQNTQKLSSFIMVIALFITPIFIITATYYLLRILDAPSKHTISHWKKISKKLNQFTLQNKTKNQIIIHGTYHDHCIKIQPFIKRLNKCIYIQTYFSSPLPTKFYIFSIGSPGVLLAMHKYKHVKEANLPSVRNHFFYAEDPQRALEMIPAKALRFFSEYHQLQTQLAIDEEKITYVTENINIDISQIKQILTMQSHLIDIIQNHNSPWYQKHTKLSLYNGVFSWTTSLFILCLQATFQIFL